MINRRNSNKALTLLVSISLLFSYICPVRAAHISPKQALQIAKKYITPSRDTRKGVQTRSVSGKKELPLYIFNDSKGQGFVVVAGDDRMGEVLAYSREGALDTLHANDGVRLLLAGYTQQYYHLKQGAVTSSPIQQAVRRVTEVAPMVKSKWGQGYPYNAKTGYLYSGCVATAMAQLMYYHRWPAQGKGKNDYVVSYYRETKTADFSKSHYDWENMLPDYRYPVQATAAQNDAVALLMSDAGISVNMQYTPRASSASSWMAFYAFKLNFDYTAAYVTRDLEGPAGFAQILQKEILNGFPVYLSGSSSSSISGHAWVTDGFDENGLFHMNFGWDGQSDGYYSLTALDVSQSGNEFNGKSLSFRRGLTAILAHPNKPDVLPIDKELMQDSPQLVFNSEGYLSLPKGLGKSFERSKMPDVRMAYFVNRGEAFNGDIGIGIYDSKGERVKLCASNDHANGGFTQRVFGQYNQGYMLKDALIVDSQYVKIDLSGLEDGYYRFVPLCAAAKDNGEWDDWLKMKRAPNMEIELRGNIVRISEEDNMQAGFQLMENPILREQLEPGNMAKVVLRLKNLSGMLRDCYVKMQLKDENDSVVVESRTKRVTEFDGFSISNVPVMVSLPADIVPKRYQVYIEVLGNDGKGGTDDAHAVRYGVKNIHDKDTAYIDVAKVNEKSLMEKVVVQVLDGSGNDIDNNKIDFSQNSLLKFGLLLTANTHRSYDGSIKLLLEDSETKMQIPLWSEWKRVSISSGVATAIYTGWRKPQDIKVLNKRPYRVVVKGVVNGSEVELWNPEQPAHYVTFEGSKVTLADYLTLGIERAETDNCPLNVWYEGNEVTVTGDNLRTVSVFSSNGVLFKRFVMQGDRQFKFSLSSFVKGVYIVKASSDSDEKVLKVRIK